MSNPAFIVDGFTEQLVLKRICPGQPIRRTDLNGKDVSIEAIAEKVSTMIRLLNNKYYPIFVIVDREKRAENIVSLREDLSERISQKIEGDQDVRVSFADQMFENWIIADWECLNTGLTKPESTDGLNGASILKQSLGSYDKTGNGVELFLQANPSVIYSNSNSFRILANQMSDINCPHLVNINQTDY